MPPFLISFLLQFKTQIIVALAIIGIVVGAYVYHVATVADARALAIQERDYYWTELIRNAPPVVHTDTSYVTRTRKDTSGVGQAIAKGVDSVRQAFADAIKNRDSLITALIAKKEFTHVIKDDSVYSMDYKSNYDPLEPNKDSAYRWGVSNVKIKQTIIRTDITKLVPLPFKRYAVTLGVNGFGQTSAGVAYRLGSEDSPHDKWNSLVIGLDYQVAGPRIGNTWYTPLRLQVTGFIK